MCLGVFACPCGRCVCACVGCSVRRSGPLIDSDGQLITGKALAPRTGWVPLAVHYCGFVPPRVPHGHVAASFLHGHCAALIPARYFHADHELAEARIPNLIYDSPCRA